MSHDSQSGSSSPGAGAAVAETSDASDTHAASHGTVDLASTETFGLPRRRVALPGGVTVATVDEGQGPAVLFLHGIPTSSALWRRVIPSLSRAHRCIAPDLLGFGESECPPDASFGLRAQVDMVIALLDALELKDVAVCGHDMGGCVAQLLASEHPDRVRTLALVDSPAFAHRVTSDVRMLGGIARFSPLFDLVCETGLLPAFARSRFGVARGAYARDTIDPGMVEDCIAPLFRDAPPAYRASRERYRRALVQLIQEADTAVPAASEGMRDFAKPTIVIWGLEDPYVPVSEGKQLAEAIPGCERFEGLAFVGHWVPEEAPDRLATLLAEHFA